ncbi:uncharacterized protein LOC128329905 [Hemicordylus capensis]|uniref:uncharacterized protein LOC128329905 n=1 Tax=Hemicordylus capensis TaxID=884348 RepID=UPI0023026BFE|nr:uncharacterized protein LOC128329905 [Hemicordylus capensis]
MFSNIMFSQLTSHPRRISLFVCCNPFGFRMAKILPPDSSRPTLASKLSVAAMLLGHMAQITMEWVKKWLRFWKSFPVTLMKAVLMGIAKGACRVALATAPLERGFLSIEEDLERNEGNIEDGEKQNLKGGHLEHLLLNSLDNLIEDGHLGEGPKWILNGSSGAKMDKVDMEEERISELCLINSSIFIDFGNEWEDSSEDDMEMQYVVSPGSFPQEWLEDCYYPQVSPKSLDIGRCFGENLKDCHSHHEEYSDLEGDLWQTLESPSLSRQRMEGLESSEDFAMHEKRCSEGPVDSPKGGKLLEVYRKDEGKGSLDSGMSTYDFKSPLVLSLFFSPSEEEDDGDEEEEEDWWNENEMEETSQSKTSFDGGDLGKEENSSEIEKDFLHPAVFDNFCESSFENSDPFHPLCFSKPIQAPRVSTIAPPEPKNHKENTVSFYLTKTDSQPRGVCTPSKHPWSQKDPRTICTHPANKFCQTDSKKNYDPNTTEISSVSQEENEVVKKVRFSPVVTVHQLLVWDYASRAARQGPWEEMARDRCRFRRRIAEVQAVLEPCLEMEHRAKAWRRIHGIPDSLEEAANEQTIPTVAKAEKLTI